jgi:hypothetical protein
LSTHKNYFTAGKSIKSSTPSTKNTKYVTPKFTIKDSENNSSSKKIEVAGKMKNSNYKNKNLNNVENSSFSRTASMTNLNSNNNNILPFDAYLPLKSPKNDNSINTNNVISKDDSIRLNSFNLRGGNNINNGGVGNAYNNIKNFANIQSKNYFKEIVESFKEKTLNFKTNLNACVDADEVANNIVSPENNLNNFNNNRNCGNNFYHSDGKISSTINYIEGNNNNILLNSFGGKLNFENSSENLNYLKYRRNKNNSINFKENNLMKSIVSSSAPNSKGKKSKSHSIHNFQVIIESSDSRLNYEYNFPFNQKSLKNNQNIQNENKNKSIRVDISNEVIQEELSTPTNNTEINITNTNRKVVYSSSNKDDFNNSKGNPLINSKNNNLSSKIFTNNEANNNQNLKSSENFNLNKFKNEQVIVYNEFSPRSVYSSKESDNPNLRDNQNYNGVIYKNNSNNNKNQIVINKNSKNNLYSKQNKNVNKFQKDGNSAILNNCTGFATYRNNNFLELKSLNYQNNLSYLIHVLNNRLLNNQAFALNSIISFSQEQIRISKRYALKMIYRIIKKRLVFLKLKFFTRGKIFF